jgi:hypothetical protein
MTTLQYVMPAAAPSAGLPTLPEPARPSQRAERRAAPSRPATPLGGGLPYPADRGLT